MTNESVLDQPKEEMDKTVWNKTEDGYVLTNEARDKIDKLVIWVVERLGISNYKVNITGSITSNSYTTNSDIDIHISSSEIPEEQSYDVNKELKEEFEEIYKTQNKEDSFIGSHPLEVYFQTNPYQDLMSAGCYDVINGKWLVGPEFNAMEFDPYDEYYEEDMKNVSSVIDDIRNVILECFETAIAIKNSKDQDFQRYEIDHLKDRLSRAANIFIRARNFRKVFSSPKSEEDAFTKRSSREWKIADSSFKLLDKFGYLGILRTFTTTIEDLNEKKISEEEAVRKVVDSIKNNIGNNENLQESDKQIFESELEEGLASNIGKLAIIASMIAVPGVTSGKEIAAGLEKLPKQEQRLKSPMVQEVIRNSAQNKKVYNGLSYVHLQNLMATIIYNEASIDYIRYKDERCLVSIANVVQNRSGGDAEKYAEVVIEPNQFFSKNAVLGGIKDRDYITYYPYGGSISTWNKCNEIAKKMIDGTLENVICKRNMIANRSKDKKSAWESWGKRCDLKIGRHTFGYEPDRDGYRKEKIKKSVANSKKTQYVVHVVKDGDNISKIAKDYKTTVEKIMKQNSWLKSADKIFVGQKLRI